MELSDTLRKAESREEWRELVAKTPVAHPTVHDYGIGEGEDEGRWKALLFHCCLRIPFFLSDTVLLSKWL